MAADAPAPERTLHPLLLIARLAVPGIACWWVLRRGYRPSLRRAVFTYAGSLLAVSPLGTLA